MTAITTADRVAARREGGLAHGAADALLLARRALTGVIRTSRTAVFVVAQPVLFLLMFSAVLSETIRVPGAERYVDQLVPAIVVLAASGAALGPGVALLADLDGGLLDRLRSSPVGRGAMLSGLVLGHLAVVMLGVVALLAAGLAVGFRFRAGGPSAIGFLALATGVGCAWIWASLALALRTGSQEAVRQVLQLGSFVLLFGSGAFVPVSTLPGWFQPIARVNPVTPATEALRGLATGGPVLRPSLVTLGWIAAVCLLCGTAAVRRYRRLG